MQEPAEKLSPGIHLRRACDLIASKVRGRGDSRSTMVIASQALGINYQTMVNYCNEHFPVPAEIAKAIDGWGYPKEHLRPDLWED